jgi:hypothetical protein
LLHKIADYLVELFLRKANMMRRDLIVDR